MSELSVLLKREQIRLGTERQNLEKQISEANAELLEISERLRYVNGLLGPSKANENDPSEYSQPRIRDIRDIAAEILGERKGEPMHYKKLAEEVQARGGDIPGLDAANTLLSRLVKDERFVRPTRRGFYGLRADYPGTESVGARKPSEKSDSGKGEPAVSTPAGTSK